MIEVSTLHVPVVAVLGLFSGVLYARHLRRRNPEFYAIASIIVPMTIWVGVTIVNITGVTPLFDQTAVGLPLTIAVPYLLSYPLWFRASGEVAFICFGRYPDQGGLLWVFRLEDNTQEIDPTWNQDPQTKDNN